MFRLCSPFPFLDLLISGLLILMAVRWLVYRKQRQGEEQVDGNQRLMIQLTILALFADLLFVLFIFTWRPC